MELLQLVHHLLLFLDDDDLHLLEGLVQLMFLGLELLVRIGKLSAEVGLQGLGPDTLGLELYEELLDFSGFDRLGQPLIFLRSALIWTGGLISTPCILPLILTQTLGRLVLFAKIKVLICLIRS